MHHPILKTADEIGAVICFITFLILITLNLIALVVAAPYVIANLWYAGYPFLVLAPGPVSLFTLSGPSLVVWYLVILFSISASVLYFYLENLPPIVKGRVAFSARRTGELFFASIFVSVVVYIIVIFFTETTPTVPQLEKYPDWYLHLALAYASFHEELAARVLLLGVPLLVVDLVLRRLRVREMKPVYRYFLGGDFDLEIPELLFLIFSSVVFGYAHMVGGWDWVKVIPTFIGGLIMGYLFLRVGLYAAVLVHFATDYLNFGLTLAFGEGGLLGELCSFFAMLFILLLGAYATLKYSYLIGVELERRLQVKHRKERAATPAPPPDPMGPYWHRLQCKVCGSTTYEYLGGRRIRCLRCGRVVDVPEELWYRGQSPPPRP